MVKTEALAMDIDNTILDTTGSNRISTRMRRVIAQQKLVRHVFALTGRSWQMAEQPMNDLDLDDHCVFAGGAQIRNPRTGEVVWEAGISESDAQKIKAVLERYPATRLVFNDFSESDYRHGGVPPSELATQGLYFVNFAHIDERTAHTAMKELAAAELEAVHMTLGRPADAPHLYEIHITNASADKGAALRWLMGHYGIAKAGVRAFGDADNDLTMLHEAGTKIAVANATPRVKAIADVVVGSVQQDGVAEYLEELPDPD